MASRFDAVGIGVGRPRLALWFGVVVLGVVVQLGVGVWHCYRSCGLAWRWGSASLSELWFGSASRFGVRSGVRVQHWFGVRIGVGVRYGVGFGFVVVRLGDGVWLGFGVRRQAWHQGLVSGFGSASWFIVGLGVEVQLVIVVRRRGSDRRQGLVSGSASRLGLASGFGSESGFGARCRGSVSGFSTASWFGVMIGVEVRLGVVVWHQGLDWRQCRLGFVVRRRGLS